jgi:hypothetical protein
MVFANLFLKPRKTFTTIYNYELFKFQYHLFVLAGINNVLARKWIETADVSSNLIFKLMIDFAIGALFGWLPLLFLSWLLYLSAKWLKGKADFTTVYNISGYAVSLPAFISLLSTIVCILILRSNGYTKSVNISGTNINWHQTFYIVVRIHLYLSWGLNFYYAFLTVIGISVVQEFTIVKSILNVLLAIMIIVIPLVIVIFFPLLFTH